MPDFISQYPVIAIAKHAESLKVLHSKYPYTSHLDSAILLALPMPAKLHQPLNPPIYLIFLMHFKVNCRD